MQAEPGVSRSSTVTLCGGRSLVLIMCFSRFSLGVDKSPGDSSRETRRDLEVPGESRLVLLSTVGYEM